MWNIIWIIIIGFLAGVIARFISPGPNAPSGFILTTLLGIAGAFVGGFIARSLWASDNYSAGWIMSIVGAILLLLIVRMIFGRGGTVSNP